MVTIYITLHDHFFFNIHVSSIICLCIFRYKTRILFFLSVVFRPICTIKPAQYFMHSHRLYSICLYDTQITLKGFISGLHILDVCLHYWFFSICEKLIITFIMKLKFCSLIKESARVWRLSSPIGPWAHQKLRNFF